MENIIKTKKDLELGDIIVLRNGDELLLVDDGEFCDINNNSGWESNSVCDICDLNDDLMYNNNVENSRRNDVMLVKRPVKYDIVFDRKNVVKEMTIKEISNILGYEVKIVKGDKTND